MVKNDRADEVRPGLERVNLRPQHASLISLKTGESSPRIPTGLDLQRTDFGGFSAYEMSSGLPFGPDAAINNRRALILMSARDIGDRPQLVTEIFNDIVIDIVEGRLLPGDSLNSVDLARRFGTSRTPVREALSVLERLGVIVVPPHRRPYATPLTLKQVKDLYDLRASLFALVSELIVDNCPSERLSELWKWQTALEEDVAQGSVDNYFWHNVGFRLLEAQLAGNEELQRSIGALGVRTLQLRHFSLSQPGRLQRSAEDHKRLLVAYSERDKATAVSMTRALIMAGYRTIERSAFFSKPLELVDQDGEQDVGMKDDQHIVHSVWGKETKEQHVTVSSGRISYRRRGNGSPLLLLHPLALSGRLWEPMLEEFISSHDVIMPDFRGHGASEWDGKTFTMENLADDLREFLDAMGIERTHVLGKSMGGSVATIFASKYPDRVDRLILCNTTAWYGADAVSKWADRAKTVGSVSREKLIPFQTDRWFSERFRKSDPRTVAHVVDIFLRTDSKANVQACLAMGAFDSRDKLGSIKAKTLVVTGEEDYATPPSMGSALANSIPHARFQVWPGIRHMSVLESVELRKELLKHLA